MRDGSEILKITLRNLILQIVGDIIAISGFEKVPSRRRM